MQDRTVSNVQLATLVLHLEDHPHHPGSLFLAILLVIQEAQRKAVCGTRLLRAEGLDFELDLALALIIGRIRIVTLRIHQLGKYGTETTLIGVILGLVVTGILI